MTRLSPLAGPGGVLTLIALAWFAAAGLLLAWLVAPSADPGEGLRGLLVRVTAGGTGD